MSGWLSWVSGKRDNKNAARDAIIGLREQLHLQPGEAVDLDRFLREG